MSEKKPTMDLDELMAEAEALIQQMDSGMLEEMNAEHRLKK